MKRQVIWIAAVVVVLALLLYGLNARLSQGPDSGVVTKSPATTRAARLLTGRSTFAPDPDAIKVGVYMSQHTGLYSIQMTDQLNHRRQLDVVPLLETDTKDDP